MIEKEIILFKNDAPCRLRIEGDRVNFYQDQSDKPFREVYLPQSTSERPVQVFAIRDSQNPDLWFIRQSPDVTIPIGNKIIEDNGFFGIGCFINLKDKQINPPELPDLIDYAKKKGWDINPFVIALLGMVKNDG